MRILGPAVRTDLIAGDHQDLLGAPHLPLGCYLGGLCVLGLLRVAVLPLDASLGVFLPGDLVMESGADPLLEGGQPELVLDLAVSLEDVGLGGGYYLKTKPPVSLCKRSDQTKSQIILQDRDIFSVPLGVAELYRVMVSTSS